MKTDIYSILGEEAKMTEHLFYYPNLQDISISLKGKRYQVPYYLDISVLESLLTF
jgi:hypothetical protein